MSDISTPALTEKELRELYGSFSKEKLIDAVVERHLQVRTLHEEMARLIHK
jgi:hypothetical protein